jgi:hypothetical protein
MAEQKTITQVVGSSIADWVKDPATGKERTPQEIIAAVTEAVLADKSNTYGTSLDPLTGQPRPATDAEKVRIAMTQLAANAKFEGGRYLPAQQVSQALVGSGRGGSVTALVNKPELWTLGKETVGTIIDRKLFDEDESRKAFVLDPTKNQITPEQLKQFNEIGAKGAIAIDPITGFQVLIDSQGRYTLGEQPVNNNEIVPDYSAYQGGYTSPEFNPIRLGGTGGTGGAGGAGGMGTGGTGGTGGMGGALGTGNPNTLTAGDGTRFDNFSDYITYQNNLDEKKANRQSAYDLLYQQFNQYGLGALVEPLKGLITTGASPSEFTIRLRESDAYKKRFSANSQRITKGLAAISEAEYLGLEDQYQNIMRNYGLPADYYARGDMGIQSGFEKFIANDVSATELEDRIMTAQNRVINSNPEVLASLKQFYPGITNGDILAYTLDPTKGLTDIKRKVTAAEIGGAATQAGLGLAGARAEELGAAGITKQQAQQGFQTVAEVAPRGGMLADIYKQNPYTQQTAEAEVFGLGGSAEAARQRKKLTSLETAAFSGRAGVGAIARDRAGVL